MAVTWERFSGSTDTFAVRLSFMPDPDHGVGAEPDESATWGALQIWVAGQNLCAHVDQGEVLQASHWYLLPFLEWVAGNWNPLLHEERLPNRNAGETAVASLSRTRIAPPLASEDEILPWEEEWFEWRQRHSLRAARAGGMFPNAVIRRLRDSIEISWDDEPLAGSPIGFKYSSNNGAATVSPDQVAKSLFEVTLAAVEHLTSLHPESARIRKMREALDSLLDTGQDQSRLAWLAGLRPSSVGQMVSEIGGESLSRGKRFEIL